MERGEELGRGGGRVERLRKGGRHRGKGGKKSLSRERGRKMGKIKEERK